MTINIGRVASTWADMSRIVKDCAGRWKLAVQQFGITGYHNCFHFFRHFFKPISDCCWMLLLFYCISSQEEREAPHLLEIVKAAKAAAKPKRQRMAERWWESDPPSPEPPTRHSNTRHLWSPMCVKSKFRIWQNLHGLSMGNASVSIGFLVIACIIIARFLGQSSWLATPLEHALRCTCWPVMISVASCRAMWKES